MLLVDDDEAEVMHGSEKRAAGADDHAPRRCARGPTGRIARRPRRECNTATSSEKRALNLPTVWGGGAISGTRTMTDFPALSTSAMARR